MRRHRNINHHFFKYHKEVEERGPARVCFFMMYEYSIGKGELCRSAVNNFLFGVGRKGGEKGKKKGKFVCVNSCLAGRENTREKKEEGSARQSGPDLLSSGPAERRILRVSPLP